MTPDDNKELVEIVARALAEEESVCFDKCREFFGETARQPAHQRSGPPPIPEQKGFEQ